MAKNADTQPHILNRVFTGWNLLAFSGFSYVAGGALLVVLTWKPKPGPYSIGERYPYGGYLEAWQVSLGFAFLAFGILFGIGSLIGSKVRNKYLWSGLLASFVFMWFPHLLLGIALVLDDPSLSSLGVWKKSIVLILAWMAIAALGFFLSWRDFRRGKPRK